MVEKLCKKVNFTDDDPNLKKISNTKIFKQLMIKFDNDQLFSAEKKEKESFDKNVNTKVSNNIEDDLPRFGGSSKKTIDANRYDSQGKERMKGNKGINKNSFEELVHDQSIHSNHKPKSGKNPILIQNPNNTMTKNESQNEDSLFKGNIFVYFSRNGRKRIK